MNLWILYSWRLDLVIFALLALLAMFAIDRRFFSDLTRSRARTSVWGGSILLILAAIAMAIVVGRHQAQQLQACVEGLAPTYAAEMAALGHDRLNQNTNAEDPLYLSLIERELTWLRLNPTVHDIYTMRRVGEEIRLIVDSETDYDHNGVIDDDREQRTDIGEVYETDEESLHNALLGIPSFESEPYSDRWGVWVSAYSPILLPDGTVDGIVGVDFAANQWIAAIIQARATVLFSCFFVICGLFGSVGFATVLRHRADSLRQANEDLGVARDEAQRANKAKSEFLANMSHEIRTPMNGIVGLTELLLNSTVSADQRRNLELIQSSADALMTVLNDILDFSKIEANKLTIDPQPFDLLDMLGNTLKLFGPRAHDKHIELALSVPKSVPRVVVGDAGRIRQVLVNLVGNSIKFTHVGEVIVAVDVVTETESDLLLEISVADTGIGIDPAKLKTIFDPFVQADNSTTRKYGGTGLGLTICQRLIALMGGKVSIQSELGKGTRITFSVACSKSSEPVLAISEPCEVTLNKVRVLVVDDNSTNRLILQEMLASWQVDSRCLDSGKNAAAELERAHQNGQPFDLVLMDVQMPDMDGFETTLSIRNSALVGHTKVIVLSSCDASSYAEQCRNLRLSAYLTKPVKQSELFESLITALERTQPGRPTARNTDAVSRPRRIARSLKILVAEDNFVNQQLILRVMQKEGHSIAIANHGQHAMEILARDSFDVVLMDVQMPLLDGYETTAAIRQRELCSRDGRRLPVIALTANAMKGDREKCIEAGMDDYASKPLQFAKLFETIARHVPDDVQALLEPAAESTVKPEANSAHDNESEPLPPVFDQEGLMERIDGDLETLEILLSAFSNDIAGHLEELESAIGTADWSRAKKVAHTVKGTAANLGAARLSQLALNIEHRMAEEKHMGAVEKDVTILAAAADDFLKTATGFAQSTSG